MIFSKFRLFAASFLYLCLFAGACRKEGVAAPGFRELPVPAAGPLSGVWFRDSMFGIVTGGTAYERGFILSTRDGGESWKTDTLMLKKMEDVCFDSGGQAYVCGQDGAYFLAPGTEHWQHFRTSYRWERACHFPDRRHGAIVGGESYRLGRIDLTGPDFFWQIDSIFDFPNELASVWWSDSLTVHAVGMGWVLRSADAGQHWERLDVTGDYFTCVHFPSPEVGYICGSAGYVYKTVDAGLHWRQIRAGGASGKRHKAFQALWFSDPETGWMVGDGGLFWRTDNGGADWKQLADVPEDLDFTDIYVQDNRGWLCSQNGRLFRFDALR